MSTPAPAPLSVLFHYAAGAALAAHLSRLDGLRIAVCPEHDEARFAALLAEAEVIWHVLRPLTAAHIAAAPKLRLIQKIGVGVNTIALDAARARGIPVCNLPGTNAPAVAEMTLLLMLAALRRLPLLDRATREGRGWALDPALQDGFGEVGGRCVGLVGFGAVPQALLPVLRALGCRVLYTARTPRADAPAEWRSLPDLLAEADIVSLHLPLSDDTRHLIDAAALARMRPGAILVNTARGGLVDQAALTEALAAGRLAAAGLDVFAEEPISANDPLLALPNVVLAPHVAWLTGGTFDRSLALAAENCRRLVEGRPLLHRVI
jgi:phosphoglycerate dehydrogenase-like enzyme